MEIFIIATEAGIKIEVRENLKKDQVEKLEDNFSEVKDFVEDKSNSVVITAQQKQIILGMMLRQATTPKLISKANAQMAKLMEETINFLNNIGEDKKELIENNDDKVIDDVLESITKAIPDSGAFVMILDKNTKSVRIGGNLDKTFVASMLMRSLLFKDC